MPGLNGVEFIRLIKMLPQYAHVPIVMITAKKDTETRYASLDSGAADFLTKPVDIYECKVRCHHLLAMRHHYLTLQKRGDALEQKVKSAATEISAREEEILMRLARTGEYKDYDTAMHLQRMALYSRAIAEELVLSEDEANTIELCPPYMTLVMLEYQIIFWSKRDLWMRRKKPSCANTRLSDMTPLKIVHLNTYK